MAALLGLGQTALAARAAVAAAGQRLQARSMAWAERRIRAEEAVVEGLQERQTEAAEQAAPVSFLSATR